MLGKLPKSLFEVVSVALPSARYASGEYEAVVSQLRTSLRTLRSDGFCKGLTPEGFAGEAEAVWTQTREAQLSPLLDLRRVAQRLRASLPR